MALRIAFSPSYVLEVTLNPASIAAATVADQTFVVNGLRTEMAVFVSAASLEAGLVICNATASAKDELKIRFFNQTGAPIDPASQAFKVIGF